MAVRIVPTGPAVKEMKQEAEDYEQKARVATEPQASILKEKATELREWISSLTTGRWTS